MRHGSEGEAGKHTEKTKRTIHESLRLTCIAAASASAKGAVSHEDSWQQRFQQETKAQRVRNTARVSLTLKHTAFTLFLHRFMRLSPRARDRVLVFFFFFFVFLVQNQVSRIEFVRRN